MEFMIANILSKPGYFRQFRHGENLVAEYKCPLRNKYAQIFTHLNYFMCVTEGKKVWHTPTGSYALEPGHCVFVRKGASVVEQFLDTPFCLMFLFLSDGFIADTVRTLPVHEREQDHVSFPSVMEVDKSAPVTAFFNSMVSHFANNTAPDSALLELKFRELILTVAGEPGNAQIRSYFRTIGTDSAAQQLRRVMEENFRYNLKLDAYAELANRSLSTFKRDFQKVFGQPPGKWILERRLEHSRHLLNHEGKTVGDAAFSSGFENASHFSKVFKARYGIAPVMSRAKTPA